MSLTGKRVTYLALELDRSWTVQFKNGRPILRSFFVVSLPYLTTFGLCELEQSSTAGEENEYRII